MVRIFIELDDRVIGKDAFFIKKILSNRFCGGGRFKTASLTSYLYSSKPLELGITKVRINDKTIWAVCRRNASLMWIEYDFYTLESQARERVKDLCP